MTPKLIARVSEPTQAIAHTGHGFELAAGDYPHVDIDGARDRGELFLRLPNGNLLCASADDPNITLHGVVATENLGSRIAVWLAADGKQYGPDIDAQIRMARALTAVVDLHVGCRNCNEGRPCRDVFVIAEALNLVETED